MIRRFFCWFISVGWTPEAVTAAGTIALAFLTLVLAVGTLFLWLATRRLVRESRKTAEQQLRAYVSIEGGQIRLYNARTQLRLTLPCKNFGQTPAYHLRSWTRMQLLERTANPFDRLGIDNPEMMLGPTGEMELTGYAAIGDENIAKIRRGESAIFVWGKINYIDAFDEPRYFNFRCINGIEVDQGVWAIEPHENGGYEAN
ncbi:MAG: hypothetical protein ACREC9_14620 [Methylocella sp.]